MPTSEVILNGLSDIANNYACIAIIWHAIIYICIILLIIGFRPSIRVVSLILISPLLSVCLFALLAKNPFNMIIFLISSVFLVITGIKLSKEKIEIIRDRNFILGIILLIYGLVYPHFLLDNPLYAYIYSAPTGLIPCPTLSVVIGFSLIFNCLHSKKWITILSILGLFYGIFGVIRLKVYLDIGLILGTLALLINLFDKRQQAGDDEAQ
jgi:hypothetical protein